MVNNQFWLSFTTTAVTSSTSLVALDAKFGLESLDFIPFRLSGVNLETLQKKKPTKKPSKRPTKKPTKRPVKKTTKKPSRSPTKKPTRKPTTTSKPKTKKPVFSVSKLTITTTEGKAIGFVNRRGIRVWCVIDDFVVYTVQLLTTQLITSACLLINSMNLVLIIAIQYYFAGMRFPMQLHLWAK